MRVAIVHERFTEYAGSEQVVEQLATEWPDAQVFAPVVRPEILPATLQGRVRGTALSRMMAGRAGYAHLLPVLPFAMRRLPIDGPEGAPDVVIASHHAFAAQVVHATTAPVVAYVHSPARWVWDAELRATEPGAALLAAFAAAYRPADRRASGRLAAVVANSTAVAQRCARWWEAPAQVVHPPVDTDYFTPDPTVPREDFFLLAGRLVPYKRPDLAVRAAALAGVRLVVAGDGRMRAQCEGLAGPGTVFAGRVPDAELRSLFRRCRALLMPGVEDFGIVPVEAQACGAPVLATAAGGALDSVRDDETGVLVPAGADAGEWAHVLRGFGGVPGSSAGDIRRHAESFSRSRFRARMAEIVGQTLGVAA